MHHVLYCMNIVYFKRTEEDYIPSCCQVLVFVMGINTSVGSVLVDLLALVNMRMLL